MSHEARSGTAQTKKCPYCAEDIKVEAVFCKHCGADLNNPASNTQSTSIPTCALCKGQMKKSTTSESPAGGCVVLVIGILLLPFFPIGTVLGIVLIIAGIGLATRKKGVLVCTQCGYKVDRK